MHVKIAFVFQDLALMSMMSLLKAESKNVKNSDKFPVQLLYVSTFKSIINIVLFKQMF